MCLTLIQSPDAFLERKQRFVDFSPIYLGLLILVDMVSAALISSQIDEANLSKSLLLMFQSDLHDGMRA